MSLHFTVPLCDTLNTLVHVDPESLLVIILKTAASAPASVNVIACRQVPEFEIIPIPPYSRPPPTDHASFTATARKPKFSFPTIASPPP